MILTTDYHTHTVYSHGKGSILDNAVGAKEAGVNNICITDHGFSHPAYGMRRRKLDKMRRECNLASKETGVNVMLGIESNILGVSGKTDVKVSDYDKLDVFLAGIHRFILYDTLGEWFTLLGANFLTRLFKAEPSKSLIERNTKVYINAIKNNPIDIITYPESSSEFNKDMVEYIMDRYKKSPGIKCIPNLMSKNIRNVYVNFTVAKELGLSDSDINRLRHDVENWKSDADVYDLRGKIDELNDYIAYHSGKRGRPTNDIKQKS